MAIPASHNVESLTCFFRISANSSTNARCVSFRVISPTKRNCTGCTIGIKRIVSLALSPAMVDDKMVDPRPLAIMPSSVEVCEALNSGS